jgi:hypothetical protein
MIATARRRKNDCARLFRRLEAELLAQILTECHGIITGFRLSTIQQRHPALSRLIEQLIHYGRDTIKFGNIAATKLGPSSRIMIEPCAQGR